MLAKMLGATPLRAAQALEALPALLACGQAVVGLADVAWGDLRGRLPGLAAPFWSRCPLPATPTSRARRSAARLAGLGADEAAKVVLGVLVRRSPHPEAEPIGYRRQPADPRVRPSTR